MSQVKAMRRAVAKIRLDEAGDAIPHVGHKQLHHFWPLLAPCFRDVLVPPHYLIDEEAVTWTWRESEEAPPPSATELGEFRRRLEAARERFSRDVAGGRVGRGSGSATRGVAGNVEQLEAVMVAMVKDLAGRAEPDLKRFVCRTESGLRVHSWGAGAPARPDYPETRGLEISGRVLVAGKPARHDVVLESGDGETIAEVPSDEAGEFCFSKLSPGEYRLRARSVRGTFPPRGLPVDLQQRSVQGLVLADARADTVSPLVSARRAASRRSRRTLPLVAVVVLSIAGGTWAWRQWQEPARPAPASVPDRAPADTSVAVESVSGQTAVARIDAPAGDTLATGTGVGAPVSGPPSSDGSPKRATGRRDLPAEGREPDPGVFLPVSFPGTSGGAGAPPPAGGPGGGSTVAVESVSTENVRTATPAGSPPGPGSGGGAPASPPEVTAASPTAPSPGSGPLPAPAAAAPVAGLPSTDGSGSSVAATPAAVAAPTETSSETASRVPAPPPAAAESPSPSPVAVAAAVAEVATLRMENAREAAETAAPVVRAEDSRREDASGPPPAAPAAPVDPAMSPVAPISAASAPLGSLTRLTRAAPVALTRTVRVRVSPWRARLLADTILPTEPIPVARSEPVAVLRARLLAETEARLPQAMREPRGRWGVALDLGNPGGDETLTWLDTDGGQPDGASVNAGRAEILWAPAADGAERQYRLARRDGAFVAEVKVASDGRDFTVRTMEETRAWLLLAVGVRPLSVSGASPKPFDWRSGSAGALPPGWRERENLLASGEAIAEAPLGSLPGAAALQSGALFDPESGWAIVTDVRQAADRPLGN